MARICEAAELKAKELGRYLSPHVRERLSTYEDDVQVAWITNPFVEWVLQRITNDIMRGTSCPVQQPTTTTPNTKQTPEQKKEDPPKEDNGNEEGDDDLGFSLFD
ncbi:MAG: hypothetical protein Satyrvirus2_18 [Satyrvirus sp.]|uniref:Uncharacterized protein n=1 Tax=Satyrvirus sp. TaxID=2487771 RepID=A0A3G5ACX7_9VIRU|nr:MAG: hypothetical protein Satyrvirus2_18 [Satyrvirus sp.]